MTQETAFQSIDFIADQYPINTGIIFFGGEPLLKKDLIKETIAYCKSKEKSQEAYFHYKVTTNGILLDEAFLEYANSRYWGQESFLFCLYFKFISFSGKSAFLVFAFWRSGMSHFY
jgi:uncharacterized radical SAM superfamily Fe-S cluster-containing enzyme